jgi:hypothetical protein
VGAHGPARRRVSPAPPNLLTAGRPARAPGRGKAGTALGAATPSRGHLRAVGAVRTDYCPGGYGDSAAARAAIAALGVETQRASMPTVPTSEPPILLLNDLER